MTITGKNGATISVNNSVVVGNTFLLIVKGKTTQAVTNVGLVGWSNYPIGCEGSTVAVPIGSEWDVTGVAYGYLGQYELVARIPADTWFHICLAFPLR